MQFSTSNHLFKNNRASEGVALDNEGRVLRTSPKPERVARLLAFSKAVQIKSDAKYRIEVVLN
jgi:hypothetical protein